MKKMIVLVISISFILSGCQTLEKEDLTPEDIVKSAVETYQELEDYYIVSTRKHYKNEELTDEFTNRELSAKVDGEIKKRIQIIEKQVGKTIIVINENKLSFYQEGIDEVQTYTNEITKDEIISSRGLKELTLNELDMISNMWDIESLGEEKIKEIDTYHLKARPKKELDILYDYEIWIDKESFTVIKMIINTGDIKTEIENTKIDLSPNINLAMFKLDIPEDVKEVNLDEMERRQESTIENAYKYLGKSLLIVKDKDYDLKRIEAITLDAEKLTKEFDFKYTKDGRDIFIIRVNKIGEEGISEIYNDGYTQKEIRGKNAAFVDDVLSHISFEEDGNHYQFIIKYQKTTLDEAIDIIEGMKQYK